MRDRDRDEASIRYWVGVVGGITRVTESKERSWWCLPIQAREGDPILMYCPRSVSSTQQGFFALYEVSVAPDPDNPKNSYCSGYSLSKGSLKHAEIERRELFEERVTASHCKLDPVLKKSSLVRKNFQGTTFEIEKVEFEQIVSQSKVEEIE